MANVEFRRYLCNKCTQSMEVPLANPKYPEGWIQCQVQSPINCVSPEVNVIVDLCPYCKDNFLDYVQGDKGSHRVQNKNA